MLTKLKITSALVCLFASLSAFSQTEEQRKYVFAKPDIKTLETINGGGVLDGLTIKKHSDYVYFDMYLDTANLALLKNKLSLRIRKRNYSNGSIEYAIQLKSEMLKPGDVRMEIDETELDYFNVFYKKSKISLKSVLENIFSRFEILTDNNNSIHDDSIINENIRILKTWLEFKVGAAIGPFQKLNKFRIGKAELQTLKPLLIGKSIRGRSHVFIDRQNTSLDLVDFPASQMDASNIPTDLQDFKLVWLMETSFDQAMFHSVESNKVHHIVEYEVENKYQPLEAGRGMLNRLENKLINQFKAEVNLESKYLQSMKAMR